MDRKHWGQHDECFACKIQTIQIAPSATPTRSPGVGSIKQRDKKLELDLAAYKRMRLEGLNPKSTEGAARVESVADSTFEVESGQLAPDMAKGHDIAKGGKEWRRRAEDAHQAIKRGEVVTA